MDAKIRLCTSKHENGTDEFDICALEDILEASHDGLFIADGLGNIEMVNSAWERICGIGREFVVGKNAQDLVNQKYYTESSVMAAIRSREKTTIMLHMTRGEKVGQKILATAIPIWDENGQIRRVVANIRDITEILYLKELLEKTKQLNELYAAELEQMRQQQFTKHGDIIARSPKTKLALEMAAQVAKVDSSVLITGESGAGKEVIANSIHRLGRRCEGPLIKINCSAIPESFSSPNSSDTKRGPSPAPGNRANPACSRWPKRGPFFLTK